MDERAFGVGKRRACSDCGAHTYTEVCGTCGGQRLVPAGSVFRPRLIHPDWPEAKRAAGRRSR